MHLPINLFSWTIPGNYIHIPDKINDHNINFHLVCIEVYMIKSVKHVIPRVCEYINMELWNCNDESSL